MANFEDIIEKIKKVTLCKELNKETLRFIQWSLKEIGEDRVMAQLRDTQDIMRTGDIKEPIKVFISYLAEIVTAKKETRDNQIPDKIQTYFDMDQTSLLQRFENTSLSIDFSSDLENEDAVIEDMLMEHPYSDNNIPLITMMDASWFTLGNNKDKSDKVDIILRTMDGGSVKVKMLRGRARPNAEEQGILSVSHAKLFSALTLAWVQRGCKYRKIKTRDGHEKYIECVLYITARDLSKLLGWKQFGGSDLTRLTDWLGHLHTRPYYIDLREINGKGYNFKLLRDVQILDYVNKNGRQETFYEIIFHPLISGMLLDRRAAVRAKDLIDVDNQVAFLTKLHIEPRLLSRIKRGTNRYEKTLKKLIEDMCLPKASWHLFGSQRKKQFEKIVKSIDGTSITTGQILRVHIEKGESDYLLVAKVERRQRELPFMDKFDSI